MAQTVEAIYENGILHLLEPLAGIGEHCKVTLSVQAANRQPHSLADCIGAIPKESAQEILCIVEDEFERVHLNEWE